MFFTSIFWNQTGIYKRDACNFVGFGISSMALTVNGGFPEYYRKTGKPEMLIMSGLFAYVLYYTTKDEIKVIRLRKQGKYLMP